MSNSLSFSLKIKKEVNNFMDFMVENECVLHLNEVVLNKYANKSYIIAWKSQLSLGYLLKSDSIFKGTTTIEHYKKSLINNDYIAILSDGALIQMAYKIEYEELVWHRLCFFPCPLAFDEDDLRNYTLLELFDVLSPAELSYRTQMVTPIRFDYDKYYSDELHTNSHLTIGKVSCRIPVYGPLSVGHFVNFVIANFYKDMLITAELPVGASLLERSLPIPNSEILFIETSVR